MYGLVDVSFYGTQDERIRPLARWYVDIAGHGVEALNGNGTGIGELLHYESQLPASWDIRKETEDSSPPFKLPLRHELEKIESHLADSSMTLCFWSHAAFSALELWKPLDEYDADEDDDGNARSLGHYWMIRGLDVDLPGFIIMELKGHEGKVADPNRHELLLLLESQWFGGFRSGTANLNTPGWYNTVNEYFIYTVLLVEWDSDKRTAKRLGIGQIEKRQWRYASPQRKFVRLV